MKVRKAGVRSIFLAITFSEEQFLIQAYLYQYSILKKLEKKGVCGNFP